MDNLLNRKVLSYRCNFLIACFVSLVMLAGATYKANAQNGAITMLVPSGCNNAGYQYTFSSINQASKDTIPLEWWSPADLGVSVIPYSTLQAASIQVRSRLYSNQLNPLQYPVHYYSANINTRAGQSLASFPNCNNYTMNTVVGAGNS